MPGAIRSYRMSITVSPIQLKLAQTSSGPSITHLSKVLSKYEMKFVTAVSICHEVTQVAKKIANASLQQKVL